MRVARIRSVCVMGISAIAIMAGPVAAAYQSSRQNQQEKSRDPQKSSHESMESEQQLQAIRTSKVIGQKVKDAQGEELGTIHDLVLTPDCQRVAYVALSSGGLWGIGNDLYAVPWSALQKGAGETCVLNISKQKLENSQGFNEDRWPAEANPQWSSAGQGTMRSSQQETRRDMSRREQDESQQGNQMAMEARSVQQRRVTKLTGMTVQNSEDQDICKIAEFVIATSDRTRWTPESQRSRSSRTQPSEADGGMQLQQTQQQEESGQSQQRATAMREQAGHLVYTVVSWGGTLGMGEKYALVPANAVKFRPGQEKARLNTDKETLQAIAFESDKWPDLSSRSYAQQIYDRFDEQPYWVVLGYMGASEAQEAWASGSEYNQKFNANSIKTIEGTIQSVDTFEPARGVRDGLSLRVKTNDGQTVTVHVGPKWYARQENISLKSGDKVKVTGSQTTIDGQSVIISTQLSSGGKTLDLRGRNGEPKWKHQEKQSPNQDPQDQGTNM